METLAKMSRIEEEMNTVKGCIGYYRGSQTGRGNANQENLLKYEFNYTILCHSGKKQAEVKQAIIDKVKSLGGAILYECAGSLIAIF